LGLREAAEPTTVAAYKPTPDEPASAKVAADIRLEAVLGKTHRTEF
jgi:hypothetical protein